MRYRVYAGVDFQRGNAPGVPMYSVRIRSGADFQRGNAPADCPINYIVWMCVVYVYAGADFQQGNAPGVPIV